MLRRAATQLAAASARVGAGAGAAGASSTASSSSSSLSTTSMGIGSLARSFASSVSAPAVLSRRVRPVPTLAWAAATAAATTSLLSPSANAAKAEEAVAPVASTSAENLYALPAATGLFSSSPSSPSSRSSSSPPPPPSAPPLTLFQYEVCPFCCKVKAVLDFYKIPYRVVEVSPLTKRQLKWGELRKVPVLALGGAAGGAAREGSGRREEAFAPLPGVEVLADSSLIISRIAAEAEAAGLGPARAGKKAKGKNEGGGSSWFRRSNGGRASSSAPASLSPPPPSPSSKEATWRKWVDGRLVKVITVNIYRTARESWQTFDYISETGDFGGSRLEKAAARVVGAGMMWAIAGRLAKKYGVEGEPRAALEHAGKEWTEGALRGGGEEGDGDESSSTPFAGGDSPDLSDLSAFGVWRAVCKTDSFADAMEGNRELREWYRRMERAVGASSRVE